MVEEREDRRVLAWLHQHGYPLELRVGNMLRDAGWSVEHAHWYTDPETSKPRELDIKATIYSAAPQPGGVGSVCLAVECKSSLEKPWVSFTSRRDALTLAIGTASVADAHSQDILYAIPSQKLKRPEILETHRTIGHGVTKAFSDNKSGDPTSPYSALRSVASAAFAIGERNTELVLSMAKSHPTAELVIPVVLLDGKLYEYSLDDQNSERLYPVGSTQVLIAHPVTGRDSIVTIVTRESFPALCDTLTKECELFCAELVNYVEDALTLTRSRTETARKRLGQFE